MVSGVSAVGRLESSSSGALGRRVVSAVAPTAEDHGVWGLRRVGVGQVGCAAGGGSRGHRRGAGLAHRAGLVPDDLDPGAGGQVGALFGPLQILAYAHDGSRSARTGSTTYSRVRKGQGAVPIWSADRVTS